MKLFKNVSITATYKTVKGNTQEKIAKSLAEYL